MEIEYDLCALQDNNGHTIWEISQPISNDLMHGLVAGACVGLAKAKDYDGEIITVHIANAEAGQHDSMKIYTLANLPHNMIIVEGVDYNYITRAITLSYSREGYYYNWVVNGNNYDLVEYTSPEFIQGIMTMCRAFNMSVDDVLLSCPLYNGNYYYIAGIRLPVLPEERNGPQIASLDDAGTQFPVLPYIEPKYITDRREADEYLQ